MSLGRQATRELVGGHPVREQHLHPLGEPASARSSSPTRAPDRALPRVLLADRCGGRAQQRRIGTILNDYARRRVGDFGRRVCLRGRVRRQEQGRAQRGGDQNVLMHGGAREAAKHATGNGYPRESMTAAAGMPERRPRASSEPLHICTANTPAAVHSSFQCRRSSRLRI
jgi:hypothetical protein